MLPNWVAVALPNARYEASAPILRPATAEIGEALVEWARSRRRHWYDDSGPHLNVRLESRARLHIVCTFQKIEELTQKIEEPAGKIEESAAPG